MPNNDVHFQFRADFNKSAGELIYMGDIISTSGPNDITNIINQIVVFPNGVHSPTKVSAIDVIQLIGKKTSSSVSIYPIGDPETLLEPAKQQNSSKILGYIKLIFALLLLFIGAALAIMYFHSDVNMKQAHSQFFYLISGEHNENPIIFSIPYSIGVGIGIAVFFKVFSTKRKSSDPGPLELEFFQNKKELQDYYKDMGD